ncbi:MAG TPA: outer membrane beta-barrel protein [Puia sp.]|nr:outer membrane beta-barrel protein [Puia sp.]
MSNLKDTDIDDLFRRASDKYPLRTDSASWDRMAAALENKGPEPPDGPIAPEEKRKRRFFWLFLLLLPLAGAGYYTWHHAGNSAASRNSTGVAASTASTPATVQNITRDRPAPTATEPASAPAATAPASAPAATAPGGTAPATTAAATAPDHTRPATPAAPETAAGIPADPRTQSGRTRFLAARSRQHQHPGSGSDIDQNSTGTTGFSNNSTTKDGSGANSTTGSNSANRTTAFTVSSPATSDRLFYDLQRAAISRDFRVSVDVTAPTVKKDSAAKPKDKPKHFYAGIFGSPDLSTVKMQSVKSVGTTFGIILGYTFKGGRWAVETGAYLDRKKYYTEGEYFSTQEIPLPANSWLTDVDGTCYMWEIPLNARYNFNPGAKTSWFATAGLSTYLMTHEKYTYGLDWTGSTTTYDRNVNLKKPSQYPFSIINLSAGFEKRLGKIGNLRVEPYVRLPLTGLGTGKLPIMSAGVNIGITRQLW